MHTLILGIGNTLLADEGVGVRVIEMLRDDAALAEDVELLDGGTLSFTLAGPIEEAGALVVVDAARLDAPPGTMRLFEGEDMDNYLMRNRRASVHEVGLIDLMNIARLAERWPGRRALIAIQPDKVDWGEELTPAVAAALPGVCATIHELLGRWRA
jgi:hydrogenase maturation protease